MTHSIRSAQPTDAPGLTRLLRDLGWFTSVAERPAEDVLAAVQRHLALGLAGSSHSIYVAEAEEGELAGYVAVHWLPYLFLPGPEGFVSELFVREEARGQGLGARLLAAVKEEASRRGCSRLSLLNNRERESYRRGFYQKQGWEEREPMANFVLRLPPPGEG